MRVETITAPRGGIELVRIPAGTFLMGSPPDDPEASDEEYPQHEVTLSSFYLAKTAVTYAQYGQYLHANPRARETLSPYWDLEDIAKSPDHPAVWLEWGEARAYCDWAGLMLPTEAQWEYACRAGTTTRYCFGDDVSDLDRAGWHGNNSGHSSHTVGELEPNPWGLYDMHGNTWEWCLDIFAPSYDGAVHRAGDGLIEPRWSTSPDDARSFRGGDFMHLPCASRSAFRGGVHPAETFGWLGFRPALRAGGASPP